MDGLIKFLLCMLFISTAHAQVVNLDLGGSNAPWRYEFVTQSGDVYELRVSPSPQHAKIAAACATALDASTAILTKFTGQVPDHAQDDLWWRPDMLNAIKLNNEARALLP
jgi:hypothetical protein